MNGNPFDTIILNTRFSKCGKSLLDKGRDKYPIKDDCLIIELEVDRLEVELDVDRSEVVELDVDRLEVVELDVDRLEVVELDVDRLEVIEIDNSSLLAILHNLIFNN